jgi:hypothetical protein
MAATLLSVHGSRCRRDRDSSGYENCQAQRARLGRRMRGCSPRSGLRDGCSGATHAASSAYRTAPSVIETRQLETGGRQAQLAPDRPLQRRHSRVIAKETLEHADSLRGVALGVGRKYVKRAEASAVHVATVPRWSSSVSRPRSPKLERPQEADDVLLLLSGQPIETVDDLICLATLAPVGFDGLN